MTAARQLTDFADIHTHRPDAGDNAVVSLPLLAPVPDSGYYSVGIHPWDTADMDDAALEQALAWVADAAVKPNVVAIGECGIDKLRGAPLERQRQIFERQVAISRATDRPMVLHAVRSLPELMHLRKHLRPNQLWVIHGYRGNPQTARQLVDLGFGISLGRHYNPAVVDVVPADRLFRETD